MFTKDACPERLLWTAVYIQACQDAVLAKKAKTRREATEYILDADICYSLNLTPRAILEKLSAWKADPTTLPVTTYLHGRHDVI